MCCLSARALSKKFSAEPYQKSSVHEPYQARRKVFECRDFAIIGTNNDATFRNFYKIHIPVTEGDLDKLK